MTAGTDDEGLQTEQECEDENLRGRAGRSASSAATRLPVFSGVRVAESTDARPASQRNSGAAKPPRMVALRKPMEPRSAARVHASSVCASIMKSTASPRAQSMYARLGAGVTSGDELKAHREVDVVPHRVPHGTVLVARERDRTLDRVGRHVAFDGEAQVRRVRNDAGLPARGRRRCARATREACAALWRGRTRRRSTCSRQARTRASARAMARPCCRRPSSACCPALSAWKTRSRCHWRSATVGGFGMPREF